MNFFNKDKMNKVIDVSKIEKDFREREDELELEKGDGLAIFLSALAVFGPVIIFFIVLFFIFAHLSISLS